MIDIATARMLRTYAAKYETVAFLKGDPSCFMHQVDGAANREAMAFIASCLSFGSRSQFMPKIRSLLECAHGDVDGWVRHSEFESRFHRGCSNCFYRFFSEGQMLDFLCAYRRMLDEYGTLGNYVRNESDGDGYKAVVAICRWFSADQSSIIPRNAQSACKRICMFLRWMVRTNSPVDLGIWTDFMDRRRLIIPLDTHVMQQSARLGLMKVASASMNAARRLTNTLAEIFPEDPLKGDFALFGYGVNGGGET